jgi:hypothetical protein
MKQHRRQWGQLLRKGFRLSTLVSILLVFAVSSLTISTASAITKEQQGAFDRGVFYFNTEIDACETLRQTTNSGGTLDTTQAQEQNARTVVGVAKTLNLGKQGALIGLMVGLAESGLKNYANNGKYTDRRTGEQPYINTQLGPVSLALPHDAVGNDNDSVGIMQQRAVDGHWGPVNPKTNLAENIKWLMTPAYAASAFFSMPAGKTESKALVRVDGWQNMPPWEAAQKVQVSAYDGNPRPANNNSRIVGENYLKRQGQAQKLINKYWDTAPLVPLPIPVAGGGGGGPFIGTQPATGQNPCPQLEATGDINGILSKIYEYAWPDYCRTSGRLENTRIPCEPLEKKPAYEAAVRRSSYKGDRCHGGGVDCGAFVTIVMRESRADPTYNTGPQGNTTQQRAYLERNTGSGKKYMKVEREADLKAGDIAIRKDGDFPGLSGHTFFFMGGAVPPAGQEWHHKNASASQCNRAPMGSPAEPFNKYHWYRLVGTST